MAGSCKPKGFAQALVNGGRNYNGPMVGINCHSEVQALCLNFVRHGDVRQKSDCMLGSPLYLEIL